MLNRLLRAWVIGDPPARESWVPAGTRVYAIGDVHGRLDLLSRLREAIAFDALTPGAPARNVVVYLGDFIDRGLQSREVIDLLIESPLARCEEVHLCGNHELVMLRFLEDLSVGPSWLQYGGKMTLRSYGIPVSAGDLDTAALEAAQSELRQRLPRRHLRFLNGLAYCHTEGDYFFAHAGVRPGIGLEAQDPTDLLWIREEFLSSALDHGKIVVHGHSISAEPEVRSNRIGIDTGAYFSGRLTCLVLEENRRRILHT